MARIWRVLRAEEDGFALEHFYGDEEGGGGVDAGGGEDDDDVVPVVGAGDQFFAEEADVENGNEGELCVEIDAGKHGGYRGDNYQKHKWRDVALRLLIGFGEQRDGDERGREEHGDGQGHQKHRGDGDGAKVELQGGSVRIAGDVKQIKMRGGPG